jgi:hypothetical protein
LTCFVLEALLHALPRWRKGAVFLDQDSWVFRCEGKRMELRPYEQ